MNLNRYRIRSCVVGVLAALLIAGCSAQTVVDEQVTEATRTPPPAEPSSPQVVDDEEGGPSLDLSVQLSGEEPDGADADLEIAPAPTPKVSARTPHVDVVAEALVVANEAAIAVSTTAGLDSVRELLGGLHGPTDSVAATMESFGDFGGVASMGDAVIDVVYVTATREHLGAQDDGVAVVEYRTDATLEETVSHYSAQLPGHVVVRAVDEVQMRSASLKPSVFVVDIGGYRVVTWEFEVDSVWVFETFGPWSESFEPGANARLVSLEVLAERPASSLVGSMVAGSQYLFEEVGVSVAVADLGVAMDATGWRWSLTDALDFAATGSPFAARLGIGFVGDMPFVSFTGDVALPQ